MGPIIIVIIVYSFFWSFDFFVRSSSDTQFGKINYALSGSIDEEIVCFGSSVSEVGFCSEIIQDSTGISCYNLSIDGTRIRQSRAIINEVLESNEKLETVVFGLSFFEFEPIEKLTAPKRYLAHYKNSNIRATFMEIDEDYAKKVSYMPFYKFSQYDHVYFKNAALGFRNVILSRPNKPIHLGWSPVDREYNGILNKGSNPKKKDLVISKFELMEFKRLINECQNKNVNVILVMFPTCHSGFTFYRNYKNYLNEIERIVEASGVYYFNYCCESWANEKKWFYNDGHLNRQGAIKLSKQLAQDLKTILR